MFTDNWRKNDGKTCNQNCLINKNKYRFYNIIHNRLIKYIIMYLIHRYWSNVTYLKGVGNNLCFNIEYECYKYITQKEVWISAL